MMLTTVAALTDKRPGRPTRASGAARPYCVAYAPSFAICSWQNTMESKSCMSSITSDAAAAALQVVIAKLQIITVREFLPIIASVPEEELRAWRPLSDKPDVSVEVHAPFCSPRNHIAVIQPASAC
jgi:hypothetical protein